MQCSQCGFDNKPNKKFCTKCGTKLILKCPQCNADIEETEDFCGECGLNLKTPTPLPPIDYNQPQTYTPKFLADKILTARRSIEGERKLVTVLFADVVDYTSLSEKIDPEEAHQIMDGCFKILMNEIHRCEGTINQFTGDGIMALFGAPVAHEDHAQRACHAALAIQKAMEEYSRKIEKERGQEFKMRIGINSGPVIVGNIGDDLKMDYTAVGDTSNLASRMETMARPGTVLISEHAHKLARDYFECKSLGKLSIKGKEEPQEAYELIRASAVEARIEASMARGLTRFLGRQKELAALKETFENAHTGSGQVVGIVGEAGVGKSRLMLQLIGTLPPGDCTCLEGRCLHYGGSMPYLPILDILRLYFDIKEGDLEYLIKKKIREKIGRLDKKLLSTLPSFHELLSLTVEDEKYLQVDPQQRRQMTFEAVRDLLIRESQNRPLILTVEDLHWIDKTSEEFFDHLIGGMANTSILLVLLYRPEHNHHWGSKSYYTQVGVGQLSTRTSVELVQSILEQGDVVPELRDLIINKAGGNPLFVEELTHNLLENGSIRKKDSQYVLSRKPSEIEVPDTIQGIIAARIDRVEENLKRIMQVASVIGREFAYRILQTIMGMREELKSQLLNLQGLEFIYEKQLFPELEYIFKHALTQEVAYNSLLLKRRKEIHEKIGKAIEEIYSERLEEYYELLAYHYVRSENKEKAVEYLDLANQKATKANVAEEAKAYFEQAMALLDTLPDTQENREKRISLVVNQSVAFSFLFQVEEYYDLLTRYEPLVTKIGNPGLTGKFYSRLGYCEWSAGAFDQSIQTSTRAAELCEASGDAEGAGYAYFVLEWSHLYRSDHERVLAFKEEVLCKMDEQVNLRTYVAALCGVVVALSQIGRWDEAIEIGQKALSTAQDFSDNSLISFAAMFISCAYTYKGDFERALEYGELAVQSAPTPADKAWSQFMLAWVWCRSGETDKGIESLAVFVPLVRAARIMPNILSGLACLGEGHLQAGNLDETRRTAEELLEVAIPCGAKLNIGYAQYLLGESTPETDTAQAAQHFEKSIDIFREIKNEVFLAVAYAGYGRYHKQQGNMAQARHYLTEALEIFERLGNLDEPDKVRKELADLP